MIKSGAETQGEEDSIEGEYARVFARDGVDSKSYQKRFLLLVQWDSTAHADDERFYCFDGWDMILCGGCIG
jgi:hypothetical protein